MSSFITELFSLRRPLIGLVWAGLNFHDDFWRTDRRAWFYYEVTTVLWSALCFLRFGVQFWLYIGDHATALGFANILLGTRADVRLRAGHHLGGPQGPPATDDGRTASSEPSTRRRTRHRGHTTVGSVPTK